MTTVSDQVGTCSDLTKGQLECLRLVRDLHTSKEIARRLGVSPHTVDARLRRAIEKLGVSSRTEAAKLLTAYEPRYQSLIYQASDLVSNGHSHDHDTVIDQDTVYPILDETNIERSLIHDNLSPFDLLETAKEFVESETYERGETKCKNINNMSILQRIFAILLVAAISAFAFGGLLSGLVALRDIVP